MRKPQSKSRLDGRSAELQAQLEVWLVDQNRGYEAMSELLAKEHGVTTTKSSLCRYYRRRLAPRRQARALFEAKARKLIAANGEEATLARARQLAFSALMEPQPDLPTAHRLLEMVTAIERTRLAQARAKLGTRP